MNQLVHLRKNPTAPSSEPLKRKRASERQTVYISDEEIESVDIFAFVQFHSNSSADAELIDDVAVVKLNSILNKDSLETARVKWKNKIEVVTIHASGKSKKMERWL